MIPFLDLKAQYVTLKDELQDAVGRVLASGWYVLGPEVSAFEEAFAAYCQTKYAVGVNSGTSALHLALLAAGVGPGDEVITVSHTFVATVAAIVYTGARPVLVDIDPERFTMDPEALARALTPRTRAVIPVHLYGQPAEMDPILRIASEHGLVVIEDAAQAHGAMYKGRRVGTMGDMACFSFYPGKNLGACGEAGAVLTSKPDYLRTLCMLRDWGAEKKYHHDLKGYNYRMEAVQGAVLGVKLKYLEQWTEARRKHASQYAALLAQRPVVTPHASDDVRHVYHVYAVRAGNRNALQQHLQSQGIATGIHYPIPVHLLKGYAELGYVVGDFPHTEQAAAEVLSLPMYAELTEEMVDRVAAAVSAFEFSREPEPGLRE